MKKKKPDANGATVQKNGGSCYAEFGMTRLRRSYTYRTCRFGGFAPTPTPTRRPTRAPTPRPPPGTKPACKRRDYSFCPRYRHYCKYRWMDKYCPLMCDFCANVAAELVESIAGAVQEEDAATAAAHQKLDSVISSLTLAEVAAPRLSTSDASGNMAQNLSTWATTVFGVGTVALLAVFATARARRRRAYHALDASY